MQNLPNGTIIGFSSTFNWKQWASWKHSFTKPFHYGIQWFTGSDLHHVAIISDGYLWEAMGKTGVRSLTLRERIKETDSVVSLYIYEPMAEFTKEQSINLEDDLYAQFGKKFNGIQAMFAFIFLNRFRKKKLKNKKMFCSKLVFKAYQNIYPEFLKGLLPRSINPERCIKFLRKKRLIRSKKLLNKENYIK